VKQEAGKGVGEVEGLPGDLDLDKEGSKRKELIKLLCKDSR